MQSPNILITNFCNQSCSFCFANKLMGTKLKFSEMKLSDFDQLLINIKKNKKIDTIKLLGGEPTLHSHFEEIINLALKKFNFVRLYTNGLLPKQKIDFLKQKGPSVKFTINVMTPAFLVNKKAEKIVENLINELSKITEITLSTTIGPYSNINVIVKKIGPLIINQSHIIRIGASNPIAGKSNLYSLAAFKKLGQKVIALIKKIKSIKESMKFYLDCGYTPCMFTKSQLKFLKKNNLSDGRWGCYIGNMDIRADLKSFICYPLSEKKNVDLKQYGLQEAYKKLVGEQYRYQTKNLLAICRKCPYFGYGLNQCSGACIGFSINHRNTFHN